MSYPAIFLGPCGLSEHGSAVPVDQHLPDRAMRSGAVTRAPQVSRQVGFLDEKVTPVLRRLQLAGVDELPHALRDDVEALSDLARGEKRHAVTTPAARRR